MAGSHSGFQADTARLHRQANEVHTLVSHRFSAITTGLLAVSTAVVLGSCSAAPQPAVPEPAAAELTASRSASFSGVSDATTIAEFDLGAGQLPENIVSAGRGVAVTFAASGQIATVSPSGEIGILGTLPTPTGGGASTPVLGFALTTGLAHVDDSYYALYATGEGDTTGLSGLDEPGEFDLIPRSQPMASRTAWRTTRSTNGSSQPIPSRGRSTASTGTAPVGSGPTMPVSLRPDSSARTAFSFTAATSTSRTWTPGRSSASISATTAPPAR